jgi:60kDa lysophospholipase
MATEIELNYSQFDAFVILHGTDTMAYTSSALSFLLEDLGKTVVRFHTGHLAGNSKEMRQIVTGAQIPLSQLRNDAVDNLLSALTIAGHYIIPGTLRRRLS